MSTRMLLTCIVVVGSVAFLALGDERSSIRVDVGNDKVTRENTRAIEQALRNPTKCDFKEVPLEEVLDHLEKSHKIEIWVYKQAIQDEGISVDTQVSLEMSGISLQSALRLILEPLGLTHVTQDGALMITTQARADELMSTRVYPIADLVTSQPDKLVNVLVMTTSGKWIEIDQEGGAITPFDDARCLVVRQTQKVHQEIEGILAALRDAKQQQPPMAPKGLSPNALAPF